ncbi:MAG: FAD dependent oxidoreductase [Osedax symbiont Rs2]|nr:MAG: FAD dependent oxidoreductase [Osedax symbiont Rs2]
MSKTKKSVAKALPTEKKTSAGCCGGAAIDNSDACCVKDEQAKAQGKSGCGCRCS